MRTDVKRKGNKLGGKGGRGDYDRLSKEGIRG